MNYLYYTKTIISCAFIPGLKTDTISDSDLKKDVLGVNLTVIASFLVENSLEQKLMELDETFQNLMATWDHKFLNTEYGFKNRKLSLTSVCHLIADILFVENQFSQPVISLLFKSDYGEIYKRDHLQKGFQIQSQKINCIHRHHNPLLSDEENKKLYGDCSRVHGHEYSVKVEYPIDDPFRWPELNQRLKLWLEETLYHPFHGQFLNQIIGNTSGELILNDFYRRLKLTEKQIVGNENPFKLSLQETMKNSFQLMEKKG